MGEKVRCKITEKYEGALYEVIYSYHNYTYQTSPNDGVVIDLGDIYAVNQIRLLLPKIRGTKIRYSYYVEISVVENQWKFLKDFGNVECFGSQNLEFEKTSVRFIRIVGTEIFNPEKASLLEGDFHIVALEAAY